jgi:hypothetical protein
VNCKITHCHIRNVSKVRFMCESPARANFKSLAEMVKFAMRSKIIFSLQFSPVQFYFKFAQAGACTIKLPMAVIYGFS